LGEVAVFLWTRSNPWCKLDNNLWEVRSRLPQRIAWVIFTAGEGRMILLHGLIKKSQKTPKDDLELAKQRLRLLS
jgi:phage-related protein